MNALSPSRHEESFGDRLRRLREDRGLTLRQFADELGVSAPAVSRWERGTARPRPRLHRHLAQTLGVNQTDLGLEVFSGDFASPSPAATRRQDEPRQPIQFPAHGLSLAELISRAKAQIADFAGIAPAQVTITLEI